MQPAEKVISRPAQVTTAWLSDVLRRDGVLIKGRVASLEMDDDHGNWSSNARLALSYSCDVQGEPPLRLFLKMVDTDIGDGEYFLPAEVTYYTRDYIDVPEAPLLHCYDAAFDSHSRRYHILLDDVSATHTDAKTLTPTLDHGLALAEGLAILHSRWWGNERWTTLGAQPHDAPHLRRFVDIARPGIDHALALFGERFEDGWPEMIRTVFDELPEQMIARAADLDSLTLIHGDPNPGNLLVPKAGSRPLYIIDQQPFDWSLTTWIGAYDLAYVMCLYWEREVRQALERPVLTRYLETLQGRGVSGYGWAELEADYRLSARLMAAVAIEYVRDGGDPRWRDFQRWLIGNAVSACADWLDERPGAAQ